MKAEKHTAQRSQLPMVNGGIALGGTLMIAFFISSGFSTWDRSAVVEMFQIGGPYLLLGLGCQISHKTPEARVLGFFLSIILLIVPLFLLILIYVLASQSGPCGALGIMFLLIPLMWIYSFVSFAVLLGKRLIDRGRKNEKSESPYRGDEP